METKPLPSVQLHSDLNSDVNSISKSGDLASPHTLEDQKEKRVGEEEREGLAEIYYLARKHYGERGASVAAKALNAGRSASEVMEIMAEEIEAGAVGDADYLGSALLYGEWSRW